MSGNITDVAQIQTATKKKRLWVKVLCIVLAAIILITAIVGITFACVWNNEISSVGSFKHLKARNDDNKEGSVYSMKIKGGFYFDDFLENGGASKDSELINYITKKITRGLVNISIGETDIGCSSFTAVTPSGDKLFARNYDFSKTNVCMVFCDPGDGRHKSFSTVDLNYIGMSPEKDVTGLINKITCLAAPYAPLDGINDAGLACGIYMSYQGGDTDTGTVATDQNDINKANITSTTMLRMILDYASDVDEAIELIKNYNLHDSAKTSFHYMIADASGKSAILEWLPDNGTDSTDNDGSLRKLVVTYNTDEMYDSLREENGYKFQWITNFIVNDHENYYENNDGKPGYDRYEHIYNRLKETDGVVEDENAAMEILKEVGRRTWKPGKGCTVHSVIYNLTNKTVMWVANENFDDNDAVYIYSLETGEFKTLSQTK